MFRNNFFRAYGFWHVGEGFQTILMMWYMAFHARLSATEIGFYQSLQLLPFLAFTAMGGSLTDRIGARLSFTASTGLFAGVLAAYGLAEPVIGFQPLAFGTYCLISGLLSALSNPAIDTFIPEATPQGAEKNALIAATVHNLAKLSGNAATLLLPVLSAVGGFVANGVLMAVSVLFLMRHPRPPKVARPLARDHALRRVPAHFRAHPESFDIFLGSVMLGGFVIPGFYIFHPLVMRESFAAYAGLFGLTGIVGWVGAILASSLALRLGARIRYPGRLALAVWALAASGFMSLGVVREFWVLLILLFFLGGNSLGKALIYGRFLRDAPEADRGLLIGIDQTALWGLATLGTLALGWLVDRIGFQAALVVNSGAVLVFVAVLALRGRLWQLRG
jgi:MFS family permease